MPDITYNDSYPRFAEYVEKYLDDCGVRRDKTLSWVFFADGKSAFLIMGNLVMMLDSKFEKPITELANKFEAENYSHLRRNNAKYMVHITCNYHRV